MPKLRIGLAAASLLAISTVTARPDGLCIDGFCIGQSIRSARFAQVEWLVPREARITHCTAAACAPGSAFRGYTADEQASLADALKLQVGLPFENVITKDNLKALSGYRYECNPAPRGGIFGERRFLGVFRSRPSGYATAVGLRLVGGELRVYRVARRFPYRTGDELRSLAGGVTGQYGGSVLVVNYLSSNAYTEVQAKGKNGWFGRSELFNPSDPTDNVAELVIIDTQTRGLLGPYGWPMSGEIKPTKGSVPAQCNRPMPLD